MNQELKQYVETTIIPKYEMFDKAHNRTHVCTVIAEIGRASCRERV